MQYDCIRSEMRKTEPGTWRLPGPASRATGTRSLTRAARHYPQSVEMSDAGNRHGDRQPACRGRDETRCYAPGIGLLILPTAEAIVEQKEHPDRANAVLHVTLLEG